MVFLSVGNRKSQKSENAPSLLHSKWPPFQCSKINKYEDHFFSAYNPLLTKQILSRGAWYLFRSLLANIQPSLPRAWSIEYICIQFIYGPSTQCYEIDRITGNHRIDFAINHCLNDSKAKKILRTFMLSRLRTDFRLFFFRIKRA